MPNSVTRRHCIASLLIDAGFNLAGCVLVNCEEDSQKKIVDTKVPQLSRVAAVMALFRPAFVSQTDRLYSFKEATDKQFISAQLPGLAMIYTVQHCDGVAANSKQHGFVSTHFFVFDTDIVLLEYGLQVLAILLAFSA